MQDTISIIALASVSPLGDSSETIWENYLLPKAHFSKFSQEMPLPVAKLPVTIETKLKDLKHSNPNYTPLDRSVLLAILASRKALKSISVNPKTLGVNMGSSRGATQLFEQHHKHFLETGKAALQSSPSTTLGNISTWVAQDLQANGPALSHSITCSTALHALLNGIAWLHAGMAETFLVGGSETPLTPFTIAQMQALKLYTKNKTDFPCESMVFEKKNNSMVLGEAASVAVLQKGINKNSIAIIKGFGFGSEKLKHSISLSPDASCFQDSMRMALEKANLKTVDLIVMHAPGTVKGDVSELKAIEKVFNNKIPALTSNKWKLGHTFGASGMLSLELAVYILKHQQIVENPFYKNKPFQKPINNILINAVGFGGNAVSIIVTLP